MPENTERWQPEDQESRLESGNVADRGAQHREEAARLRTEASEHHAAGRLELAEQREALAEGEDSQAEFEDRATALEAGWLADGWRQGKHWDAIEQVRGETRSLQKLLVPEGEDPALFDRWRRSTDIQVERELRKARKRLLQFQKLLWRAELLGALGERLLEDNSPSGPSVGAEAVPGETSGSLEYRNAMLARWREAGARKTSRDSA